MRSVAVGDHQFVVAGKRRQRCDSIDDVCFLDVGVGRLAALQQSVAAQRGDDPHGRCADRRDHGRLDGVQPVLGLVEDDRRRRLEDLVGHFQRVEAAPFVDLAPDVGVRGRAGPAGSA